MGLLKMDEEKVDKLQEAINKLSHEFSLLRQKVYIDDLSKIYFSHDKEKFKRISEAMRLSTEYGRVAIDRAIFVNSGALILAATFLKMSNINHFGGIIFAMFLFVLGVISAAISAFVAYKNFMILSDAYGKQVDMNFKADERNIYLKSMDGSIGDEDRLVMAERANAEVKRLHKNLEEDSIKINETARISIMAGSFSYFLFFLGAAIISISYVTN